MVRACASRTSIASSFHEEQLHAPRLPLQLSHLPSLALPFFPTEVLLSILQMAAIPWPAGPSH
jgi:hypothetical protein